jgi:hypothetical protein
VKYLTVILLFITSVSWAQTDTLIQKPDTLLNKVTYTLDSLKQSFTKQSDSIKESYATQKQKLVSVKQRYLLKLDSIKNKRPAAPGNPLDTLSNPVETARYTKKIDSLDLQLAAMQQNTTKRIDSLKQRVSNTVSKLKLPKEAQGKANGLTTVMDKVNVPSFDSDLAGKLNLPGMNGAVPELPGANVPGLNIPNANLPDINPALPGTNVNAPDLNGKLPDANVDTGKLKDITGQAGDIQKQVTDATGSTEGLGKTLEGKASEQIKGLPDQKLPDQAGLPGGIPKTGEAKEQLAAMAKKEAVNHFAGKEAALMGAMEKMGKYKQKYNSVSSLKDIENEKHHNELKGKPLRERLTPSLTLQFQSWHDLMLDINPSIGYKFTQHFTAGFGYNHRIAFNLPARSFNPAARVFGFRSYGEYTFKKGFGFRLDIESMNTPLKQKYLTADLSPQRDWVWSVLIGVKQKYPIYKKLKGNAQLMYNIFDRDHRSPYTDRVNFRIGLELTLKKKKQPAKKN